MQNMQNLAKSGQKGGTNAGKGSGKGRQSKQAMQEHVVTTSPNVIVEGNQVTIYLPSNG